MLCGSISESLPRQVHHLPQCGDGLGLVVLLGIRFQPKTSDFLRLRHRLRNPAFKRSLLLPTKHQPFSLRVSIFLLSSFGFQIFCVATFLN